MKRRGVIVCILLAFALVVSVPFSAHAVSYVKTYYDPEQTGALVQENVGSPGVTNDTYTIGANFSSGFNLKVIAIDVDSVAGNGTVKVTFAFPCQAGNGNPSEDAECVALNLGGNCDDSDPYIDCDGIVNSLDDAPDLGVNDEAESYRFNMIGSVWNGSTPDVIRIEVLSGLAQGNPNVFVRLGAGVSVSPQIINFATNPTPKQFTLTLTNVNPLVNLTQDWGFFAFANSDIDGPGEDSFRGDVLVDQPGLNCVSKTFDKTILLPPGGVVTATASVANTGDIDFDADPINGNGGVVITSVMSNAAKMTIVPGTSTIGDPVEGPPGTWTFPPQTILAPIPPATQTLLTFSYDVSITGMLATDELCNQITAKAFCDEITGECDLTSDGPRCRACVTSRTNGVPALGTIGYSLALAMVTMGGVMLYRQRRRRA